MTNITLLVKTTNSTSQPDGSARQFLVTFGLESTNSVAAGGAAPISDIKKLQTAKGGNDGQQHTIRLFLAAPACGATRLPGAFRFLDRTSRSQKHLFSRLACFVCQATRGY